MNIHVSLFSDYALDLQGDSQTIPSDPVHERIDDYELLNIPNSSFSDLLQAALNFVGKSSASGTLSRLAVNERFLI